MSISIQAVKDDDYEEIANIYSYESVIEQTSQIPYLNTEFWRNLYRSKSTECIELIALVDDAIAGHLGILLNTSVRRKHIGRFGIAVHPDHQGKGVGKALMEDLTRLADNWLNLQKLELDVCIDNHTAIALYKKYDFLVEGIAQCDIFKRGKYCDAYRMARFHPQIRQTIRPITINDD